MRLALALCYSTALSSVSGSVPAPVLAIDPLWVDTDSTPEFTCEWAGLALNDDFILQIHSSTDFTTPDYEYSNVVDAGELSLELLDFVITALADATWYARVVVERAAAVVATSNTISFTVDAVSAVTYTANPHFSSATDATFYDITVSAMEPVSAGRVMQAAFAATNTTGTRTVTSAVFTPTVGSVVNLVVGAASSGVGTRNLETWWGVVPEDTTGTLRVTWSTSVGRCSGDVITISGVQTPPSDTSTTAVVTGTSTVVTLDAVAGGLLMGTARHSTNASNTTSWTTSSGSLTEISDNYIESVQVVSSAVVTGASGAGVTMTATFASFANHSVGLSWTPL